jgi:FeS assembly SUF system protein
MEQNIAVTEPAEAVDSVAMGDAAAPAAAPSTVSLAIYEGVVAALRTVFDPEIPVNVYDLGLIYRIDVIDRRRVELDMTLTAPGCPVADDMLKNVKAAAASVDKVEEVKVELVFDPPWAPAMMSDEVRLDLGMFGF